MFGVIKISIIAAVMVWPLRVTVWTSEYIVFETLQKRVEATELTGVSKDSGGLQNEQTLTMIRSLKSELQARETQLVNKSVEFGRLLEQNTTLVEKITGLQYEKVGAV